MALTQSSPIQLLKTPAALLPADIELVVAPAPAFVQASKSPGKPKPPAAPKGARWTAGALANFERRYKAASEAASGASFSFRVHFSEGGYSAFLFLKDAYSAFELQSQVREAFGDVPGWARDHAAPVCLNLQALKSAEQGTAFSTLALLFETAVWKSPVFGEKAAKKDPQKVAATFQISHLSKLGEKDALARLREANALGEANNWVRTLAVLPTNELTPLAYRKWIEGFARSKGLKYDFWDTRELARKKAGSILAVLRADPESGGGIVRLAYRPKASKKKLVLVGKGICFDTGGYNVKTGGHMLGMHNDMTGSAVAAALCGLYADLEADVEVVAYLALAENLISPTAYKPNEVVIACNGKSIEVIDTDAEGRMVLADTLALADREKPSLLLDFATLTGAVVRAIDVRRAGVFSNQESLLETAYRAGEESGERVWGFPIGADYMKELDSKVADLRQCASSDNADHIYAATFLSQFVGENTPWIHVDLAPNEVKGGLGLIGTETTGFGILWAYRLAATMLRVKN